MRFFKWFFFLLVLGFIFANVYVATLPSFQKYEHVASTNGNTSLQIKQQIISFQNWENLSGNVKIKPQLTADPIHSELQVVFYNAPNQTAFTIDNQYISDTLVVQHLYGFSGVKASVAQWRIRPKKVALSLQENFSTYYKWKRMLGYTDVKTKFLQNNYKALLNWETTYILPKQERITDTITSPKSHMILKRGTNPSSEIIRLPKQ